MLGEFTTQSVIKLTVMWGILKAICFKDEGIGKCRYTTVNFTIPGRQPDGNIFQFSYYVLV
jgi:hypothetical protein